MRVWLVVERRDFAEAMPPVESLRLGESLVGFQPEQRKAPLSREVFQMKQDPGSEAETTGRLGEPHALDLAMGRVTIQCGAHDWLFVQRGNHGVALRRSQLRASGRIGRR